MKKLILVALTASLAATMMAPVAEAGSKSRACKIYAKQETDRMVNRHVGTGLVTGAGTGLLVGALIGKKSVLPGLGIGAVAGTLGGAIVGTEKRKRFYRAAYNDCMSNY
jgi:uncharacterized membrane protein